MSTTPDSTTGGQLKLVDQEVAEKQQALEAVNAEIGRAHARQRTGKTSAGDDVRGLRKKRDELEIELAELSLTRVALAEQEAAETAEAEEQQRNEILERMRAIVKIARKQEDQLAKQVIATGAAAKHLEDTRREFHGLQREAERAGLNPQAVHPRPADASALVPEDWLGRADIMVERWRERYVEGGWGRGTIVFPTRDDEKERA